MKSLAHSPSFAILLLLIIGMICPGKTAQAQNSHGINIQNDVSSEITSRFTRGNSARLITSRDETVNLVVAESGLAIQFTEKFLDSIDDEIREDDSSTLFSEVIISMASSGVRTLLDHAILIPFHELAGAEYSHGRIIITDVHGDELFNQLEINEKQVMEDFSRRDARQFVAEIEKRII